MKIYFSYFSIPIFAKYLENFSPVNVQMFLLNFRSIIYKNNYSLFIFREQDVDKQPIVYASISTSATSI